MPKKPGYKDGRDKSNAPSGSGVMGHDKQPKSCNGMAAQRRDMGRVDERKMDYRGTSEKAFGYKY